jgi:hypothetical protein
MLVPRDATSNTMLRALGHSLGALDAAITLDVDRTDEDRAFFSAEKAALQTTFDDVFNADQAFTKHLLLVTEAHQARVELGDAVLDRGVRAGKTRMKLELRNTSMPVGADEVFPSDISEIVDAERRVEPGLVLKVLTRFSAVPEFPGKDALKADLEGRATRQEKNFADRDAAEVTEASLDSALSQAVARGADALYRLEKRLLERFPREKVYVRAFFLDVAPARKRAKAPVAP